MAEVSKMPISKTKVVVIGYIYQHFNYSYTFTIEYIMLYLNGNEGTHQYQSEEDEQDVIADEGKYEYPSERLSNTSTFAMQFFITNHPNRRQFVQKMKIYYDSPLGNILKVWRYFCHHVKPGEIQQIGTYKFIPNGSKRGDGFDVEQVTKQISKTKLMVNHPRDGYLNINIDEKMVKKLDDLIEEEFASQSALYHYIDIGTTLQVNSGQMMLFRILMHDKIIELSIINYDLHKKGTDTTLYGIITPNSHDCKQQNDFSWRLSRYMTKDELCDIFDIKSSELPISSRRVSLNNTYKQRMMQSTCI